MSSDPAIIPPSEHLTRLRIRRHRIDPEDVEGLAAIDWAIDELERRRSYYADVQAFHRAADVPHLDAPGWPSRRAINARIRWIESEVRELKEAVELGDLAGAADAYADITYFALGGADECGFPFDAVWDEVQASNMRKLVDGPIRDENGKLMKPEGWEPPDIARVLGLADA